MNKHTKGLLTGALLLGLAAVPLSGCGSSSGHKNETITVQVQEINNSEITAQIGSMKEISMDEVMQNGNMGTPPSGAPNGNMGTPPSGAPNGNMGTPPSGAPDDTMGTPPNGYENRQGGHPDGDVSGVAIQKGSGMGMPSKFTAGDDTVTFTIPENASIKLEGRNGEEDGSLDDITADSVLEVTFDKKGAVTAVVVKRTMNRKGGNSPQSN